MRRVDHLPNRLTGSAARFSIVTYDENLVPSSDGGREISEHVLGSD